MTEYREITKPVVPQCVADWYEENKDNFEDNLADLLNDYSNEDFAFINSNLKKWLDFNFNLNRPIQTLVNMHQFGYKVKKEKLYTVELPDPNNSKGYKTFLAKNVYGKVELFTSLIGVADDWKQEKEAQLTEDEIKKDFEWAFKFKKEVEEDE